MTRLCRLFRFVLLMGSLPAFASHTGQAVPILELRGLGRPTVELGGPWQFHLGDEPHGALPTLDDSGWERMLPTKGWGAQGHFAYQGFGWYRLHIAAAPVPDGVQEFALFVPYVADAYQVFWNGQLVGQQGEFPPSRSWPNYPLPHTFALGAQGGGVLAVRVWKAPLVSYDPGLGGGFEAAPLLGSAQAVQTVDTAARFDRLRGTELRIGLALLYVLVVIAGIAGWLQHRRQPLLLWLSLFAFASTLQAGWWHAMLGFSYVQEALFAAFYQPLEDIATWFLLIYLLELRADPRVMRWVRVLAIAEIVLCTLDAVAVARWANGWPQLLDGVISEVILLPELFPVALVAFALRKRLPPEAWLVAAFALLTDLTLEVGSFLSQGDRFTHWTFWRSLLRPLFTVGGNGVSLGDLSTALLLGSLVFAVYRSAVKESRRQQALEQEFHSAQELQRVLIPEDLPPVLGYEISSAYRPAQEVGGDFFQLLPQGRGSALLILGDVSGKGLTAAMAVALIVGTIRTLAEQLPSPAEMLAGINRRLVGKLHGGFATCVAIRLNADGSTVVASAGHPGPFLNGVEMSLPPALPLGLSLDVEFEERRDQLGVGDHLLLYSDGLLEARNSQGELFGFERIGALSLECTEAAHTADAATAFGQEDDITVVAVTRLRVGAESRTSLAAPLLVKTP